MIVKFYKKSKRGVKQEMLPKRMFEKLITV